LDRVAICVAGGKGGVGKTFIAINIARLAAERLGRVLIVDADVDNPSTPHFLGCVPQRVATVSIFVPRIDSSRCRACGRCVEYCPEHALALVPSKGVILLEDLCSGCRLCKLVCPHQAIGDGSKIEGWIELCETSWAKAVVGELAVGSRREAIVIKRLADYAASYVANHRVSVVDSPPGTGAKLYPLIKMCSVVAIVTEPTPLGLSDYLKFLEFLDRVAPGKRFVTIANKWGVSREVQDRIERVARERNSLLVKIPYSSEVPSVARREIYVESRRDEVTEALERALSEILEAMMRSSH